MIYLLLIAVAIILLIVFAPFVFLLRVALFFRGVENYFHTVAVGIDQLGGSILYDEENHTISAYTHYLALQKYRAAIVFEKFINLLAWSNTHCKSAYDFEVSKNLFTAEELAKLIIPEPVAAVDTEPVAVVNNGVV